MTRERQISDESRERALESGVLVLDIPVIHKGYIELLKNHSDGSIRTLYLIGEDVIEVLGVPKEIRAVDPETVRDLLQGLFLPFNVEILHLNQAGKLPRIGLFTGRDEVSRRMRERFFPNAQVTQETTFLRWDTSNVTVDRQGQSETETNDQFHIRMMKLAREEAELSSDGWRQVGVVIVKDGVILPRAHNTPFPTENAPYIDGNPRDHIKAGELGFLSGTAHGEQLAISKIAKMKDVSSEGADLYLTSFPCHACASDMGEAGIARCFFAGGNAYLNVEETLKAAGIKTIFVRED